MGLDACGLAVSPLLLAPYSKCRKSTDVGLSSQKQQNTHICLEIAEI